MNRSDLEVMNRECYNAFLTSNPIRKDTTGDNYSYKYGKEEIWSLDSEYICFNRYLLLLNQRLSEYEGELVESAEPDIEIGNIWNYLYEALDTSYGLCLSDVGARPLRHQYKAFLDSLGLETRDFDAIRILLGIMHLNIGSSTISLYSDSFLIKDIVNHYIALSILKNIDLCNSLRNESTVLSRNRRVKKCTSTMVFNKIYSFNTKILTAPASSQITKEFPNIISSSIDSPVNSLLIHKKMLLSDADFDALDGAGYIGLETLIKQSQKLYRNLVKKDVAGNFALDESFILEELDAQTCCLPVTLLYKWLSQQNVSYEVKRLLSFNCDELTKSLLLFFLLLCNLPHYMAVSVLNRFNETPSHGLFTGQSILLDDSSVNNIGEILKNIELLNQVLSAFLFDIFPFIDRTINAIVAHGTDKKIEEYKLDAYSVLSSSNYRLYRQDLQTLYNKVNKESYYDSDIIQDLDRLLSKPFLVHIQMKYGLDIVKGDMSFLEIVKSQIINKESIYSITHQTIIDLFIYLYNENRTYFHFENEYKNGRYIFNDEEQRQCEAQSILWATKDSRWNQSLANEQLTESIYTWVKNIYDIDSSYKWGRVEDEKLVDLLRLDKNISILINGLTKRRYHYKDTFQLSDSMKKVKKCLYLFFRNLYTALNSKEIEAMPVKSFVLRDDLLKEQRSDIIEDTFDENIFWLYLPYINRRNVNEFLDAVVTCSTDDLRKSYLSLYDTLEDFLWALSLYLENDNSGKIGCCIRLKKAVLDKAICEPMYDRMWYNGLPNLGFILTASVNREKN